MMSQSFLLYAIVIFLGLILIIWLLIRCILLGLSHKLRDPELTMISFGDHQRRVHEIAKWIQNLPPGGKITRKPTLNTHLFGLPMKAASHYLDLSQDRHMIESNSPNYVHVQGSAHISQVIASLLSRGYCLQVVPDMTHLTVAGLFAGVGGGSASFKYGAFSDSVIEVEYVDGVGNIRLATSPADINILASSLGSLGYLLSFKIKIRRVHPWVYTRTERFDNFEAFRARNLYYMTTGQNEIDFLDGTIFSPNHLVIITGKLVPQPIPGLSVMTARLEIPYWQRVQRGYEAMMRTYDYIYRWDPDGYYSSMDLPSWCWNGFLRRMLMRDDLMSSTKLRSLLKMAGMKQYQKSQIEEEVADFLIPMDRTSEFATWFDEEVALYPVYICPARITPSVLMQAAPLSMDWGLGYGVKKYQQPKDKLTLKHKIMEKTYDLGGDILKYFAVFRNENDFWSRYTDERRREYDLVKQRHDPLNRFYRISEKLIT